jgi:hypothetical protein
MILTSRNGLISSYFFVLTFTSKVNSFALHFVFLERKSWSQPYHVFLGYPPSLIMPPSVQFEFSLGMELYEGRFGLLQGVRFHAGFFFRISKLHINKFDIGLKQTHSEEIQVIHMDRFS